MLVRRGYSEPAAAAAFLAGESPGHDPFLLGDMRAACERIRAAIERRHAASACTATTTWTESARPRSRFSSSSELGARSTGTCRAGSRRDTALSGQTLDRLADEGYGLVLTVDCGITAVDEIAAARARGST